MTEQEKNDNNELHMKFRVEKKLILKFNIFLELFCKDNYEHLIDTDENAGEFMRRAISEAIDDARKSENIACQNVVRSKWGTNDQLWSMQERINNI